MDAEAEPPGMGLRRAVKIDWLSLRRVDVSAVKTILLSLRHITINLNRAYRGTLIFSGPLG